MKSCKSAWMFNASSGAALCERYMGSETRLLEGQWQRSDLRQQNSMPWPQRSVKPERLALVPDLCLVAGGAGVCSRLDRVEDRFLFVQVFAVNLILNQHYPARMSLITVDSKEHRDEPQGVPGVLAYLWSVDALAEY
jgi:hypothetical protein